MGEGADADATRSKPPEISVSAATSQIQDRYTDEPEEYAIEGRLGAGGMGTVLAAKSDKLARAVALKVINVDRDDVRRRFERETRVTARLQHPGIVPVYGAGRDAKGQPFFVMKQVVGEPLDRVIANEPTFAKRMALLPNVIAVVEAIAYAHKERVIHRDLKPANILVGAFGETVVIDWGLAKDVASSDEEVDDGPFRTAAGDQTAAGKVMGTPAYMPLEQARGERVDEHADVYALGAILYHALAGRPPYVGADETSVPWETMLARVITAPPRPLAELQPDTPPDLLAIVTRAMARVAGDRYPTAQELAADLRRFQTGQLVGAHRYTRRELFVRWVKRNRGMIAVGSIAVVVLAVLAAVSVQRILHERTIAEDNGELATANRNDVEQILDFMMTDLRDKLAKTGQARSLVAVSDRVQAYLDKRQVDITDVDDVDRHTTALFNLAAASATNGDFKKARALYQQVDALAKRLGPMIFAKPHIRDLQFRAEIEDAVYQEQAGDAAGAVATFDAIEQRGVPALDTRDALVQLLHASRGHARSNLGRDEAALADFVAARDAAVRYLATRPHDANTAHDAAETNIYLADELIKRHRFDEALVATKDAIAIDDRAISANPDNPDVTVVESRARAVGKMGNVYQAMQSSAEAMTAHLEAAAWADRAYAQDPSSPYLVRVRALETENLANSELAVNKPVDGIAHLEAVLQMREQLHMRDPKETTWARDLAASYGRMSAVYQTRGDLPHMQLYADKALAINKELVAVDPGNVVYRRDLMTVELLEGDLLGAQNKLADSLVHYRAAADATSALVKIEPNAPLHGRDLAMLRGRVSTVLYQLNRVREAADLMNQAASDLEPVVKANPAADDLAYQLGVTLRQQAQMIAAIPESPINQILPIAERSVAVLAPVAKGHPTNGAYAAEYAVALNMVADLLFGEVPERRGEAFRLDTEAEQVLADALARDPKNAIVKLRVDALATTAVRTARKAK